MKTWRAMTSAALLALLLSAGQAWAAATAVYAQITNVDGPARGQFVSYSNIAATTDAFPLDSGLYVLRVKASTFGTVTLQMLGPDGVTWLTAMTAIAADGVSAATWLPNGSYRLLIA